jgi:SDR family mycofactocin-dependent oxidoreductase
LSGRLEGKVAFITGGARGQGRAHAVRTAEEGADIITLDICRQFGNNPYPLSTPEDLAETERAVKELGRRIVARHADVRERHELRTALDDGLQELGKLDVVVAQAGILPMSMGNPDPMNFVDAGDVDLVGVMNTVAVALPHLSDGASVIITGSTAAMMTGMMEGEPGGAGYAWAKSVLIGYSEQLALLLARRFIRVNCMHPTNVNTHLIHNEAVYKAFRPDLGNPTREDVAPAFVQMQGMPIPYVEPVDIANLAVFLASDESRYITGQQIRVDAGALIKYPNGPM